MLIMTFNLITFFNIVVLEEDKEWGKVEKATAPSMMKMKIYLCHFKGKSFRNFLSLHEKRMCENLKP
jgi:hypothetical protein